MTVIDHLIYAILFTVTNYFLLVKWRYVTGEQKNENNNNDHILKNIMLTSWNFWENVCCICILNWDFNAGTTHYRTDRLYSMIGYLSGTEQLDFEANCPVLDD